MTISKAIDSWFPHLPSSMDDRNIFICQGGKKSMNKLLKQFGMLFLGIACGAYFAYSGMISEMLDYEQTMATLFVLGIFLTIVTWELRNTVIMALEATISMFILCLGLNSFSQSDHRTIYVLVMISFAFVILNLGLKIWNHFHPEQETQRYAL